MMGAGELGLALSKVVFETRSRCVVMDDDMAVESRCSGGCKHVHVVLSIAVAWTTFLSFAVACTVTLRHWSGRNVMLLSLVD